MKTSAFVKLISKFVILGFITIEIRGQCNFNATDKSYSAFWFLDPKTGLIRFQINAEINDSNFWTGIGFGSSMTESDMIVVTVFNGAVHDISDRHGKWPEDTIKDKIQDIKQIYTKIQRNHLTVAFSRAVDTGDKDDLPLLDKEKDYCQDFMFPVSGGHLDNLRPNGQLERLKHLRVPSVRRICNIDQCLPLSAVPDVNFHGAPAIKNNDRAKTGPPSQAPPGFDLQLNSGPQEFNIDSSAQVSYQTIFAAQNGTFLTGSVLSQLGKRAPSLPLPEVYFNSEKMNGNEEETIPIIDDGKEIQISNIHRTSDSKGSCTFTQDGYDAAWIYEPVSRKVIFTVNAKLSHNRWAGIGFGQSMENGDFVILYDFRGFVEIRDAYSVGYAEPKVDPQQDVKAINFNYTGDRVTAVFQRFVDTGDIKDVNLQGSDSCQYFIFPTSGGQIVPYANERFNIKMHDTKPVVKLICDLDKCLSKDFSEEIKEEQHKDAESSFVFSTPPYDELISSMEFVSAENPPEKNGQSPSSLSYKPVTFPLIPSISNQKNAVCDNKIDHKACKMFIDDYLAIVFSDLPKTDIIFRKACKLLQEHQNRTIFYECCNYLTNVCFNYL